MNFSVMGNLNMQLKTMEMETRWYLKKESKDYTAKCKSLDEWISSTQEAMQEKMHGNNDEKLKKIHSKLDMGEELTPKEREYLKAKDPQAYKELLAEEAEQRAYEEKLRKCKTKEEVDSLQVMRINSAISKVRAVENNPNIPLSKKLEVAMREKRKLDDAMESTRKFIKSGQYAKLPSEKDKDDEDKNEDIINKEHAENEVKFNDICNKHDIDKDENISSSEETRPEENPPQENSDTTKTNTSSKFSNTGYYSQANFDFSGMDKETNFDKKA
jgi:hypothetical protein